MNDVEPQDETHTPLRKRYFRPQNAVRAAYAITGSWRNVRDLFGFGAPSMWRMAATGKISVANENRLRLALRLMPRRCLRIENMSDAQFRLYMETRC
jgi:hypothetical protein